MQIPIPAPVAPRATGPVGPDAIGEIRVEGNQRIEADTVRSYMQIAPGDRYDADRVNRSLKTLFATGLFADVTMQRTGNVLLVRVVENPIINRIAFEGNKKLSDEALTAEVQLKPRIVYTRTKVQSDVQRIVQLYRRSGRFAATVEPKVIQLPQNRVDLVFEIYEGDATTVSRINIVGNREFSDGKLREAIATKESRWYRIFSSNDSYDPDRITFDREQLRRFYLSRGFADFRVVSAVAELTPEHDSFYITFTVEEGQEYKFGKVEVDAQLKDLNADQLRAVLRTKQGDVYNAELVDKTIEDITFELGRLGYAFVEVRPRVDRDPDKRTVGIVYEIKEGPRVYVERIDISGNVRTLDKVIRREFRIAEGDAFNAAKLRRSRTRIRGLGFFEKVDINQRQGSAPDKTVITVDVTEKSTGELSLGAGYSTSDSVLADIQIRERNLLGRGQDIRLGFSVSPRRQQIDLSFTEPYFLDRELAAGFDIFHRRQDLEDRSSYNVNSTGGALRMGYPVSEAMFVNLNYRIRNDNITDVQSDATPYLRRGSVLTSSVGYGITYDKRDDKIEPTSGYVIRAGQDFAGLGGDNRYIRTTGSIVHYFPVADEVVFSAGLDAGIVKDLGKRLDINSRFFIGGDSFRGFEVGGIGPRDQTSDDALGGEMYYVGTAEVIFPLGLPNEFGIKGRLFTQAGSLFDIHEKEIASNPIVDSSALRLTAGFGISWTSPFGPIRVDLGFPLMKEKEDETELFRFNFGTRF
ncbi:outer membrane protein assembly factor BamA [Desertibaculum subflavum]|uniref:outer membrane protein assembly factor BamA n=1 Tax=Desertibaculum subflavum TaxID=2268458 RepID=UPI0034D15730